MVGARLGSDRLDFEASAATEVGRREDVVASSGPYRDDSANPSRGNSWRSLSSLRTLFPP